LQQRVAYYFILRLYSELVSLLCTGVLSLYKKRNPAISRAVMRVITSKYESFRVLFIFANEIDEVNKYETEASLLLLIRS
jgi:hypothetical protein